MTLQEAGQRLKMSKEKCGSMFLADKKRQNGWREETAEQLLQERQERQERQELLPFWRQLQRPDQHVPRVVQVQGKVLDKVQVGVQSQVHVRR